jgi:hypothetical protein
MPLLPDKVRGKFRYKRAGVKEDVHSKRSRIKGRKSKAEILKAES